MPSSPESRPLAALLLTGGASRRMGVDKARILVDGVPLGRRIAAVLRRVASPVLEVGPGFTGLPRAPETDPGSGPLAAIADGTAELRRRGHPGAALVLSTDLVAIDVTTLARLAHWPGSHTVIPRAAGRPQPLCARFSGADLDAVAALLASGERSLRPLLNRPAVELTDALDPRRLADADTPAELDALGLDWRAP